MNFKPGDKVRFLNTTGGGIVVKEINAFMVSVAIEDGFEIPTLTAELVAMEPAGKSGDLPGLHRTSSGFCRIKLTFIW